MAQPVTPVRPLCRRLSARLGTVFKLDVAGRPPSVQGPKGLIVGPDLAAPPGPPQTGKDRLSTRPMQGKVVSPARLAVRDQTALRPRTRYKVDQVAIRPLVVPSSVRLLWLPPRPPSPSLLVTLPPCISRLEMVPEV